MDEVITNVNWLAVVTGAVAAYLLGWLWYSQMLFGKGWMEGVGLSPERVAQPSPTPLIAQALGTFLFAWVFGITAANEALLTVIVVTLTIMALVWANGLFVGKSSYATGVEVGYIAAMAVVLFVFQAIF